MLAPRKTRMANFPLGRLGTRVTSSDRVAHVAASGRVEWHEPVAKGGALSRRAAHALKGRIKGRPRRTAERVRDAVAPELTEGHAPGGAGQQPEILGHVAASAQDNECEDATKAPGIGARRPHADL